MRPTLALWLARYGVPDWLVPDYAVMVGLAGLLGAYLHLRRARRDGAEAHLEARAIALGYLAALAGGYVFEWIRVLPRAIAEGSFAPFFSSGRAAYGGLLFGVGGAIFYLAKKRREGASIGGFLDRLTLLLGASFALVRIGCFLAGCDYGVPTSSALGVRFPEGSLAAVDHATRGYVALGSRSLPVHPTELYEAALGVIASLAAFAVLRRPREREGGAFCTWILVYAVGRFGLEFLRGDDAVRGIYGGVSTAQWVSLSLAAASLIALRRWRTIAIATAAGPALALLFGGEEAHAQQPAPPSSSGGTIILYEAPGASSTAPAATTAPAPVTTVPAPPPPVRDKAPTRSAQYDARFEARATLGPSITLGRPDVPSGMAYEFTGLYRSRVSSSSRFAFGLEARATRNTSATHWSLGAPIEYVAEAGKTVEISFMLVFAHTWFDFDSPFYAGTNAWGMRGQVGIQFILGKLATLGLSPLSFNVISSQTVGVITAYEPRLWFLVAF